MMKRLAALCLFSLVTACASMQTAMMTPKQKLFAAKQSYAVALTAAVAYRRMPFCVTDGPKVCADEAVVLKLQKADAAAKVLLDAADEVITSNVGDLDTAVTAATHAVAAIATLTKALEVK